MMNKPQWLLAKAIGAGQGPHYKILDDDQHFELLVNLSALPGVRPFKHFSVQDGTTINGTAIYADTGFGAYVVIDAPFAQVKERLT
jgi:hypothetical protein